jgi:hypothetical protein
LAPIGFLIFAITPKHLAHRLSTLRLGGRLEACATVAIVDVYGAEVNDGLLGPDRLPSPCLPMMTERSLAILLGCLLVAVSIGLKHRHFESFVFGSQLDSVFVQFVLGTMGWIVTWFQSLIASVALEYAGSDVVLKILIQDLLQTGTASIIFDRDQQLDSTIKISSHPIGAGDEHSGIVTVLEIKNSCVFK